MVAVLRVVLDQLIGSADPQLAEATRELAQALVAGAPAGCAVEGIAPAGDLAAVAGLGDVQRSPLARRELAAALQLGVAGDLGGGMIHSPTLLAPLVRHDRVHDHDQTVVTVWDLRPWDAPDELPRPAATWYRAMLKRAARYADAVVVPTHAQAARLLEIAPRIGDRVRVVSGAAPAGFRIPTDEIGRRRGLDLPDQFVLLSGGPAASDALAVGFAAVARADVDAPVVVLDVPEGLEPAVVEIASAAGVPERRVHARGHMDAGDRAAVFGAALAYVAPSRRSAFPWRVVDALALGVPVVAADSDVHREVVVDGGALVADDALGDALAASVGSERLSVLARDRGRVFSWSEAAEKTWTLHADI